MFQSTTISEPSMQADMPEQLTLSPEAIPASHSVLQEDKKAKMIRVTSGRQCLKLSGQSGPLGSLLKMLLVTSNWGSTMCSLTWKAKGTPRNRLLFRLVPSMHDTAETGSGLWATPRASEYKDAGPVGSRSHSHMLNRSYLCAQAKNPDFPTGKLNPEWVEWLMGYPVGWTE